MRPNWIPPVPNSNSQLPITTPPKCPDKWAHTEIRPPLFQALVGRLWENMRNQQPIIQVEKLTIYRQGNTILKSINWKVREREHWVILGANGSGKTSLLSALNGYLMPSDGNIQVLGRTYGETDWRDLRKEIGLVSSELIKMVEPWEDGLGIVASGRKAIINSWKISRAEQVAAKKILRQIEAAHLEKRLWQVLSQGERQRLLIGRALMARPKLLILDEPCAGLDPVAREHFLNFVQRLARQRGGPSLVLVTHHVEEIMPNFSHVLLLKNGSALAQGKINVTLTPELLSRTFGAQVQLKRNRGRNRMTISQGQKGKAEF